VDYLKNNSAFPDQSAITAGEPHSASLNIFSRFNINPNIAAAALVGIGIIAASGITAWNNYIASQEKVLGTERTAPQTDDADGNGISDWEDTLNLIAAENAESETDSAPKVYATKTEALAASLFGTYVARKNAGVYTPADNERITAQALSAISTTPFEVVTEADIRISTEASASAANAYKSDMASALEPIFGIPEYELYTYARAVEVNTVEGFARVAADADIYAQVADTLTQIKTPVDILDFHIQLINGFRRMSFALSEMSRGFDDPVASYAALSDFGKAEAEIGAAFQGTKAYFMVTGVE
jgi:hypothetical protein